MRVGGIVLCGGMSSRMGRAKEWLLVGGETLLARTVRVVGEVAEIVVVAGRSGQALPSLAASVEIVHDEVAGAGPVAGMEAGLRRLCGRCDVAVVTACDHPGLKADVLRALTKTLAGELPVTPMGPGALPVAPEVSGELPAASVDECRTSNVECRMGENGAEVLAVIVEHLGRRNPLLGVYRTELADRAREFLLRGDRSAVRFADECQARVISSEAFRAADAELASFVNVNDAEAYSAWDGAGAGSGGMS